MKLKVVSLNIFEGELLDQATDFIIDQEPDVVLLQEVYGGNASEDQKQFRTFEVLQKALGLPHSHYAPSLRHNREEGKFLIGNATFSRHPILKEEAIFFNEPYSDDFVVSNETNHLYPHNLLCTAIGTPVGEANIFNIHGTWDLDGDNFSEQRKQMSEAIIKATASKTRVILAGDTNAKPTNQAMRNVEEHLSSVFGDNLKTTFNMKRKDNPGYATAAVDMMFVSSDVKVLDKSCPNVDISDHLPLVATLKI